MNRHLLSTFTKSLFTTHSLCAVDVYGNQTADCTGSSFVGEVYVRQAVFPLSFRYATRSNSLRARFAIAPTIKPVSSRVKAVLPWRHVLQVFHSVIKSITVLVVDLVSLRPGSDKSRSDNSVSKELVSPTSKRQIAIPISPVATSLRQNTTGSPSHIRNNSFNTTQTGNCIGRKAVDRSPHFVSKIVNGKLGIGHAVFSSVENGLARLGEVFIARLRAVPILTRKPYNTEVFA